jgi:hypothetical protein
MVTIHGEGGNDTREVAPASTRSHRRRTGTFGKWCLGGDLWGAGRGILITHTMSAAPVATAPIESMAAESLPVSDDGESTTGFPMHIAFRRP